MKNVFISYSHDKVQFTEYIDSFLTVNGLNVIRDEKEDHFENFMEKIKFCDEVVFLFNTSFFESVFCAYELLLWSRSEVPGCVITLCHLNLDDEGWLMDRYEKILRDKGKLSLEQQEAMEDILSDFSNYAALIKKVSSNRMHYIDDHQLETATANIFTLITGKEPTKDVDDETKRKVQYYVHGLDEIRDEELRWNFQSFIYDLLRGSSFVMSPYNEDPPGEKNYELMDYKIGDGDLGAYMWIRARNDQGKEELLTVFDIRDVVRVPDYLGKDTMKYNIEIEDRNISRDNKRLSRPGEEKDPICRQRCFIKFRENNAYETGWVNGTMVYNYVQE